MVFKTNIGGSIPSTPEMKSRQKLKFKNYLKHFATKNPVFFRRTHLLKSGSCAALYIIQMLSLTACLFDSLAYFRIRNFVLRPDYAYPRIFKQYNGRLWSSKAPTYGLITCRSCALPGRFFIRLGLTKQFQIGSNRLLITTLHPLVCKTPLVKPTKSANFSLFVRGLQGICVKVFSLFNKFFKPTSPKSAKYRAPGRLINLNSYNDTLIFFGRFSFFEHYSRRHLFLTPLKSLNTRPVLPLYYSTFVTSILSPLFSSFINSPVSLLIDFNYSHRLSRLNFGLISSIRSRLQHMHSAFANIIFVSEFLDVLYFTLLSRDFESLKHYIRRIFNKLSIWDHKKFVILLINMFAHQLHPIFTKLGIRGFYLRVKGKLGVGGNSRKRSASVRLGEVSSSKYPSRASFLNSTVTTTTGVLGLQALIISDPVFAASV